MKIGNIREIVTRIIQSGKSFEEDSIFESLDNTIQGLPKKCLEEFFQKKFNKNIDYDEWFGIREALDRMGRTLLEQTITIIGDTVFVVRHKDQDKILELQKNNQELEKENIKLQEELSKFIEK